MRLKQLLAVVAGLLGAHIGVQAAGRQLLATTNTSGIQYDSSKDYMLLGCFLDAFSGAPGSRLHEYFGSRMEDNGMSADRCASMAREVAHTNGPNSVLVKNSHNMPWSGVRGLNFSAFGTSSSEWCSGIMGNVLPVALTWARAANMTCELRCSDPSAADVSCGGPGAQGREALTLYVFKGKQGYTDLGCYTYSIKQHPGSTDLTATSAAKMSPAECYRLSAAYDFFGLVNGSRCIGFTSLRQAAVAPAAHSSPCSVPCAGSAAATCGGRSSMQLYARNKPVPQLAPVSVTPNDHVYLGYIGDQAWTNPENWRLCSPAASKKPWDCGEPGLESLVLRGDPYVNITDCASAAKRAGKRYFGLQPYFSYPLSYTSCRAGSSLTKALRYSTKPGACDTMCAPDNVCRSGGPASTSLFVLKSGKDYTNLGCYALRPDRPPLPQLLLDSTKMTSGSCAKKAAAFKFFALFNGTRCYAGNDLAPSLRHGRGSTGCTTPCGSKKQTCGGPAAFMVYVNHEPQAAPPVVPLTLGPAGEVPQPLAAPTPNPSHLQRQRLLEGKDAMDPTWSSPCLRDWVNTTYPCNGSKPQWESVRDCEDGMVLELRFAGCRLDGTLPTTWGALPGLERLERLYLWMNRLKGTLPSAWDGLTSLKSLCANTNRLTGQLPKSWSKMTALQEVCIPENQLTGTLPESWGQSSSLQGLTFFSNRLREPLPASWGNLTGLHSVTLYDNSLTGTLPASWGGLPKLLILDLARNAGLTGTLPCAWSSLGTKSTSCSWAGMPSMCFLTLGGTDLEGCYPSATLKEVAVGSSAATPSWPSPVVGIRGVDPQCPPCP